MGREILLDRRGEAILGARGGHGHNGRARGLCLYNAHTPRPHKPRGHRIHKETMGEVADYKKLGEMMVKTQLVPRGIRDERVLRAMEKVPRHLFVGEEMKYRAYEDSALPIGDGQTL